MTVGEMNAMVPLSGNVVWNNPSKYGVGSEALHLVKVSLFLGIIIE